MRRDLNKPFISWTIRIAPSDRDAFRHLVPKGLQTWVVEQALLGFCDLMESEPERKAWAHDEVQEMLFGESRGIGKISYKDLTTQVPTDLYMRFNKLFPEWGASSWAVRRLVHQIVEDMREQGSIMEDRIKDSVRAAMTPSPIDEAKETIHQGPDE